MLDGTDPDQFELATLPRLELEPGQTEFLEVTFRPTRAGAVSAAITIRTDTPESPIRIALSGTGILKRYQDDDPDGAVIGDKGIDGLEQQDRTVGVAVESGAFIRLHDVTPNPAGSESTVHFAHPAGTTASFVLIDSRGVAVWSQNSLASTSGERTMQVPVANLPTGSYLLRMSVGATTVVKTLVIAR